MKTLKKHENDKTRTVSVLSKLGANTYRVGRVYIGYNSNLSSQLELKHFDNLESAESYFNFLTK